MPTSAPIHAGPVPLAAPDAKDDASLPSLHTPVLFTLAVVVVVVIVAALVAAYFAFGLEPTFELWAIGVGVIVAGVLVTTVINQLIFRRWLQQADSSPPAADRPAR